MIILSLICAVLAAWALVPRAPTAGLSARLSTSPIDTRERRRVRWWLVGLPLIAVLGIATAAWLAGGVGAALALAFAISMATAIRLALSHAGLRAALRARTSRSEEHTSELQSHSDLVCRLLLEKKKTKQQKMQTTKKKQKKK